MRSKHVGDLGDWQQGRLGNTHVPGKFIKLLGFKRGSGRVEGVSRRLGRRELLPSQSVDIALTLGCTTTDPATRGICMRAVFANGREGISDSRGAQRSKASARAAKPQRVLQAYPVAIVGPVGAASRRCSPGRTVCRPSAWAPVVHSAAESTSSCVTALQKTLGRCPETLQRGKSGLSRRDQ